jgi:hypothetical protein
VLALAFRNTERHAARAAKTGFPRALVPALQAHDPELHPTALAKAVAVRIARAALDAVHPGFPNFLDAQRVRPEAEPV